MTSNWKASIAPTATASAPAQVCQSFKSFIANRPKQQAGTYTKYHGTVSGEAGNAAMQHCAPVYLCFDVFVTML